jgi:hypothetical protein
MMPRKALISVKAKKEKKTKSTLAGLEDLRLAAAV